MESVDGGMQRRSEVPAKRTRTGRSGDTGKTKRDGGRTEKRNQQNQKRQLPSWITPTLRSILGQKGIEGEITQLQIIQETDDKDEWGSDKNKETRGEGVNSEGKTMSKHKEAEKENTGQASKEDNNTATTDVDRNTKEKEKQEAEWRRLREYQEG